VSRRRTRARRSASASIAPGPVRTEWLRLRVPAGTVALRVPTPLPVTALVDGPPLTPVDGSCGCPRPHRTDTSTLSRARGGPRTWEH
jgi:hypothetical protein